MEAEQQVATSNASENRNGVVNTNDEEKMENNQTASSTKEVTINAGDEHRKAAFAKDVNRAINLANVETLLKKLNSKGYREAEIIQVVKAEEAIAGGDISIVDINGNKIDESKAKEYYLILDGQHRTMAVSKYNQQEDVKEIILPATIVELRNGETISEYINDINITKKEWETADYVKSASNISPEDKFLARYKELILTDDNPNGYSLSTLNLIFCGNNGAIKKADFSLLCSGEKTKGKKVKKQIIPPHNLERGNRFIELCKEKKFSDKEISRRYLASKFEELRTSRNEEEAMEIFRLISQNDREAMFNHRGKLDEEKINEQFKAIESRYDKKLRDNGDGKKSH